MYEELMFNTKSCDKFVFHSFIMEIAIRLHSL